MPVPYSGSSMTADDLGGATREISAVLDAHGVVSGDYTLEVSTPGLDRFLVTEQDFRDFAGHPVRLVLARMTDGRRRLQGVLVGVDGEGPGAEVVIDEKGSEVKVALGNIQAANLRVDIAGFGSPRKAREERRKKRNSR